MLYPTEFLCIACSSISSNLQIVCPAPILFCLQYFLSRRDFYDQHRRILPVYPFGHCLRSDRPADAALAAALRAAAPPAGCAAEHLHAVKHAGYQPQSVSAGSSGPHRSGFSGHPAEPPAADQLYSAVRRQGDRLGLYGRSSVL